MDKCIVVICFRKSDDSLIMRFQQTDFWTFFKCNHGWEKVSADFLMKNGEKQCVNILYRTFKIGFFRSSLAYIPMAPEFESDSPEDLKDEKKIAEY